MTINALTVALQSDLPDSEVQDLLIAIRMLRGVLNVRVNTASPEFWIAEERARCELVEKLWDVLSPKI